MGATLGLYLAAAIAEIAGCFAFWAVLRSGASPWWLVPGCLSLILFGWLLTFSSADAAGRAFAAYGGIYIVASLAWLILIERVALTRWDLAGGALALAGCVLILVGRR